MTDNIKPEGTTGPAEPSGEPAYVISKEELDALVGKVQPKDDKESSAYERAKAEIRAELEVAQKQKLEELSRQAESERILRLEQELAAMKSQTAAFNPGTYRRGVAPIPVNPLVKDDKGRVGIPKSEIERATKERFFPHA